MIAKDVQKTANIVAKEIFVFVLKALSMILNHMNAFMRMIAHMDLLIVAVHINLLPQVLITDTTNVEQTKLPFKEEDVIVIIKMDMPD